VDRVIEPTDTILACLGGATCTLAQGGRNELETILVVGCKKVLLLGDKAV
jgi:hypothetical protein